MSSMGDESNRISTFLLFGDENKKGERNRLHLLITEKSEVSIN